MTGDYCDDIEGYKRDNVAPEMRAVQVPLAYSGGLYDDNAILEERKELFNTGGRTQVGGTGGRGAYVEIVRVIARWTVVVSVSATDVCFVKRIVVYTYCIQHEAEIRTQCPQLPHTLHTHTHTLQARYSSITPITYVPACGI